MAQSTHESSETAASDAEKALNLTPVRRRVLELLQGSKKAFGAYEVLDRLTEEGFGSKPPVAYRALDFLMQHGLVHRIEKLNAYVACPHPEDDHSPAFLVCRNCRLVAEAHCHLDTVLSASASGEGFTIERTVVEAIGLCKACGEAPCD
ncbi:MAG: transcriptional repressor [Devosia sp.]